MWVIEQKLKKQRERTLGHRDNVANVVDGGGKGYRGDKWWWDKIKKKKLKP